MADNFVLPVKLLLKKLDAASKLADDILEAASGASATKALQISEAAPLLQRSLDKSSRAVRDTYWRNVGIYGEPFTTALVQDKTIKDRLNKLKNDIGDKINEIDEDPEYFDPTAFLRVREQAERSCADCMHIFNGLGDQLSFHQIPARNEILDDRASLPSSIRRPQPGLQQPILSSQISPPIVPVEPLNFTKTALSPSTLEPPKPPHSAWVIGNPAEFNTGPAFGSSEASNRRKSREVSPSSKPDDPAPRLISKDIVNFRINANEEWLNRRRESRILFQNELKNRAPSRGSFASIEEYRVSEVFSDGSPIASSPVLGHSGPVISPIDGRNSRTSLNGYDTMMLRKRSHGGQSQASRGSRTSSILQEQQQQRPLVDRQESHESQESIFGLRAAPSSPPLSEHRASGGGEQWTNLAPTLQVPGFGVGIAEGKEVVVNTNQLHFDHNQPYFEDGLIAVVGGQEVTYDQPTTPSISVKSIDCPIRSDASFYRMKGFCEGAKAITRGETGFKVVKRPSGHYSATVSARCIKCSYEVGWNDVEKDRLLDQKGIYGNSGIRWRQKFISKCHVRADSIESAAYACIFCIDEHKTVEDHDATVFFSVVQLFRHLATHTRPVPNIPGITVLYGMQPPSVLDFDLHFISNEPAMHPFSMREIGQKVATRPSAQAIKTFHPKNGHSISRDPSGGNVLHFAAGARIVGITFPLEFGGKWCIGYHDGERGAFPVTHIALEKPDNRDYLMDDRSTLVTFAKWDFAPTQTSKGTDWLHFKKGEKITCVGYTFPDNWCWSGQTARGKGFGLFPQAFVESCEREAAHAAAASPTVPSKSAPGFISKWGLSLGRNKSARQERLPHGRTASIASASSGESAGILVKGQAGLEVVASPIHGSNGWKT